MIRLGIIGCGSMGAYHAKKFSALPGVTLTACFDRDPLRAARFAAQWNIANPHSRLESFFEARGCDALTCALADAGHAEVALLAGMYRLPLFLEKPMAMDARESSAILASYRDCGLPLAVNFSKRNSSAVCLARRLVLEGAVGAVSGADFSYLQSWLVDSSWGAWKTEERWRWRTSESASCFGVLGDLGSHLFDIARFVLHGVSLSLETAAGSKTKRTDGVGGAWEELVCQGFGTGSGVRFPLRFEMSRRAAGHLDHLFFTVTGDKGTLDVDLDRSRDSVLLSSVLGTGAVECKGESVAGSYEDFIALVQGKVLSGESERLSARGQDGHAVQCLLDDVQRLLEAQS